MIQLQNVTKRIKENTVLDNVSYTFKSGFVYGLYGQNGSGKTMLLRAISGLINLDSGSIFIDGEKLMLRLVGEGYDFGFYTGTITRSDALDLSVEKGRVGQTFP